jgi:hypothetical protein
MPGARDCNEDDICALLACTVSDVLWCGARKVRLSVCAINDEERAADAAEGTVRIIAGCGDDTLHPEVVVEERSTLLLNRVHLRRKGPVETLRDSPNSFDDSS